jgi:hypothetical protein
MKSRAASYHLVLLGLWLVLSGLFAVLDVRSATASLLLNVLAIAVGAVMLLNTSAARSRNSGFILLAIAFLGRGLLAFLPPNMRIAGLGAILDLMLFGAGVLLWVSARGRKLSRYPGILLLGSWLVATGLVGLLSINFLGLGSILSLLAVAAGVLVLLDR